MRIAMWSGPRNLSTALMYAFAARGDCDVMDEPFYASYLQATGLNHPMRAEILKHHETDPCRVVDTFESAKPHLYMKHMAHHMIPEMPLDWAADCTNVYLIRHPARVIASYRRKHENPSLKDLGYPQQATIFESYPGPVIDSTDIRRDPKRALKSLCAAIGLPWSDTMLCWRAGGHASDGVWAAHWYDKVHQSTGFDGAEGPMPAIEDALVDEAMPFYETLKAEALII